MKRAGKPGEPASARVTRNSHVAEKCSEIFSNWVSRSAGREQHSVREGVYELWVDVAGARGGYQVTAGLMGCDVGVVVAVFSDLQSAYSFAADFKMGRVSARMHGREWEMYVREIHRCRNFSQATLASLLSRCAGPLPPQLP